MPRESPFAVALLLATVTLATAARAGSAPASAFNLPGQARTRTCVAMKTGKVPLRFSDGTPTGWFVNGEDPSRQGGNHQACAPNTMEVDLHEVLTTASGMQLCFHPGGGPSHYRDWVTNGQYGHVALEDLVSPPEPLGSINGKPAPPGEVRYFITPTRLPRDLWYKPNVSHGHSGSTYYTYGNPGFDKTGGRGDWTYLNWSWVQNGGAKYPQNKCGGGGMVRALAKRDDAFTASQVEPIIGYSYGANNAVNGRVTAVYGNLCAGQGEPRTPIYGWTVHSYQQSGDIIVPCMRRAEVIVTAETVLPQPTDRAERMSWNLLHPMKPDSTRRAAIGKAYAAARDPLTRMELITELSRLDDAETVRTLLQLRAQETDPRVREQAVVVLGFLAATPRRLEELCAALTDDYQRPDTRERLRILDVVSNFPTPEAARFVASFSRAANDAERLAAADAVLKLAPRIAMPDPLVRSAKSLRANTSQTREVDE